MFILRNPALFVLWQVQDVPAEAIHKSPGTVLQSLGEDGHQGVPLSAVPN